MMSDRPERSERAEAASDIFWICFSVQPASVLMGDLFGWGFLDSRWWLGVRIAASIAWAIAGAVWAWETIKQRRKGQAAGGGRQG